jgi:DNA primase
MDRPFDATEIGRYYEIRVPDLKQTTNRYWRGPCPIHNGERDSFSVDSETGRWYCFSACGSGGSIFDLEMALTDVEFRKAKLRIFRLVGRL